MNSSGTESAPRLRLELVHHVDGIVALAAVGLQGVLTAGTGVPKPRCRARGSRKKAPRQPQQRGLCVL